MESHQHSKEEKKVSKYSFHQVRKVSGALFAYVMDDYGYLRQIHRGRVNYFLNPLH